MPEVSIIVLCHDRWKATRLCLESVRRSTDPALYELLAYDNASTDSTAAGLRRLAAGWPQLRIGRNAENLSFAAANNRGMREAKGRYFLWLNNDTAVTPGWLEGLLSAVRSSGSVAAAGPMTDHQAPPGQISRPFATRSAGKVADAAFLGGFCLLLSREAVERVGPLDERFLWGWEDMDYCMRLRQAGRRLVIARDVFVAHAGSRTLALLPSAERERQDRANRSLMLDKWLASPARRDLEGLYAALPSPWRRLTPRVSVLLACRTWARAKACLGSLRRAGGLEECEVLAVDVSGEPRLTRRLESAAKGWPARRAPGRGCRVLGPSDAPTPGGAPRPATGLNRAVTLAKGDHLAVFDDRARLGPGWLAALLRTALSRPDAGAVRPASNGRAGWLAPKRIFDRVGAFDEGYRGSACSADFLLRVLQSGLPIVDAESCRVSLAAGAQECLDIELADRARSLEKWGGPPASATPRLAKELGGAPELSIIVLCRGSFEDARERLEAASRAAGSADFELLAVPLDPPPGAWRRLQGLADRRPRLRLLGPWSDRSPAAAFNRAATHAQAGLLVFLDDRADPAAGWLERLLREAHRKPYVGVIRPASAAAPTRGAAAPTRGAAAPLTGFATSRRFFERLGGFDERFSGSLCGWDYWMRALQAGAELVDAAGSRILPETDLPSPSAADRRLAISKWISARRSTPDRLWKDAGLASAVSVILLCREGWGSAKARLEALRRALRGETGCEVLAGAFDAPPETSRGLRALAKRWPRLRFVGAWPSTPYAHALNLASEAALGDFLLFLADDAEVKPGFLGALLAAGTKPGSPAVVAPGRPTPQQLEEHCVLIPRSLFSSMGGFDRRFEKDLWARDFCLRALQGGFALGAVDPDVAPRRSARGAAAPRVGAAAPSAHDRGLLFGKWSGHPLFQDESLRPAVSLIILCRRGWGEARERLEALRRALGSRTRCEVLAGAFATSHETSRGLRALAKRWPQLRFVGAWPPTPYAHALNLASEAALGDYLLFLDDDAAVEPGFLEAFLAAASKADALALVAPGPGTPRELEEQCVLIPKRVFSSLGGFDRRFEKDLWARDFCLRALQGGFGLGSVDGSLARRRANGNSASLLAHDRGLLFGKWSGHPLFEAAR